MLEGAGRWREEEGVGEGAAGGAGWGAAARGATPTGAASGRRPTNSTPQFLSLHKLATSLGLLVFCWKVFLLRSFQICHQKIYNCSIKHFLFCFVKGGSTLSPVIIDRARLIDIPEMSDVAPTLKNCPSLLYKTAILAQVLRRFRLSSTKFT